MSRIQVKETSKRIWIFVHIPMYATIGDRSAYVRGYRGKSHVYQYSNVFRDNGGHIKRQQVVHNESAVGQGKAIQCVIHLVW